MMCLLVGSKIVTLDQADKALSEFSLFHKSASERKFVFQAFDRAEERLD